MEEKKNPRIPPWRVWVLVIATIQALSAVQNFQGHQLLWDAVLQQDRVVMEHIENQNQHSAVLNRYMRELNLYLAELKKTLDLICGKFQGQ